MTDEGWRPQRRKLGEEIREEARNHQITPTTKFVEFGENDPERWYRMQSNGQWYAVRSCCRSCATKLLQGWGVTDHEPNPAWLVKL